MGLHKGEQGGGELALWIFKNNNFENVDILKLF
jgi:hypothetical protein